MNFSKFFSTVQEANWYQDFLQPVKDEVTTNSKVLDVGTGPGKLLEILMKEKEAICTGIDIDEGMLEEARKKLAGTSVSLLKIKQGEDLPFQDNSYDCICFCNVLFNLPEQVVMNLLSESFRLLKPNGKILILTPSGKGRRRNLPIHLFRPDNYSFWMWLVATRSNARRWSADNYSERFSHIKHLAYQQKSVFYGFGSLEILLAA